MSEIKSCALLERPPGLVEEIRRSHGFDSPERLNDALDLLEDWLKKQGHFVQRDFSRQYLERYLMTCKGSIEKVKKLLDGLCTMRTMLPKFFTKTNVKVELQSMLKYGAMCPLPKLTDDHYRVLILNIRNKDFQSHHITQMFQCGIILFEYLIMHDYVNGIVAVHDYRKVSILEGLAKVNPVELQQYMSILVEGYGARLKGIYLMTESKAVDVLVKFIKQFLSEKLSSRVHVVSNPEELSKHIPKKILPEDYSGAERSMDTLTNEWVEILSSEGHVRHMQMMNKACTDESRRPVGQFNEEYTGMPGSFRKLTVD